MPFESKSAARRKPNEPTPSSGAQPLKLLTAAAVGLAVFFAVSAAASLLAVNADAAASSADLIARVSTALAAFVAGFIAARPTRRRGFLMGLAAAVPLTLALIGVSMLADRAAGGVNMLVLAAVALPTAALGGIAAANMRKKNRK